MLAGFFCVFLFFNSGNYFTIREIFEKKIQKFFFLNFLTFFCYFSILEISIKNRKKFQKFYFLIFSRKTCNFVLAVFFANFCNFLLFSRFWKLAKMLKKSLILNSQKVSRCFVKNRAFYIKIGELAWSFPSFDFGFHSFVLIFCFIS